MRLYNALTQAKADFEPADPDAVTLYVCGPTTYNLAHIGNARPAVVFDVLFRVLQRRFDHVVYARNITDIDDKIMAAAVAENVATGEIVARYAAAYDDDMGALNVLPPTIVPYATEHVPEMIAMIERLIASGHAYAAEGHVLFNVPSYPDYGHLSRRSQDEMLAGARVEVAPYKKSPSDFVLWKPSTEAQPGWDSPWGRGRPGWHVECSAMIERHLGPTIDIHGGGIDLKFPHHENEVAQSVCAHDGAPLARFWMHNGMLNVDAEKMSKSVGNVLIVRDLLDQAPGEAVRWALLAAQYRQPLDWSDAALAQAKSTLDRLYRILADLPTADAADGTPPAAVVAALEDDLNTPQAFTELVAAARATQGLTSKGARRAAAADLRAAGALLGVLAMHPADWFAWAPPGGSPGSLPDDEIDAMIEQRRDARARRDFQEADAIRDALQAAGIVLEDGADGTRWMRGGKTDG